MALRGRSAWMAPRTSSHRAVNSGSPMFISRALVALVGAAVTLLMVVMRALLRQATWQHAELADVV